jgi:hypothetical protein
MPDQRLPGNTWKCRSSDPFLNKYLGILKQHPLKFSQFGLGEEHGNACPKVNPFNLGNPNDVRKDWKTGPKLLVFLEDMLTSKKMC